MTLLLGIVSTKGAWLCSDHRLVDAITDKPFTDLTSKQIHMRCKDGSALLAYTGIGRFRHPDMGDTDVSDWVRRSLRARNLGVGESVERITHCSMRRLGPLAVRLHQPHHFAIVAFIQRKAYVAEVSNVTDGSIHTRFELRSLEVTKDSPVVLCAGWTDAVLPTDVRLLRRLSRKTPSRFKDYMQVLAAVNRHAADNSKYISASCTTTYVPIEGEPFQVENHDAAGHEIPDAPIMLFGIDMTEQMRVLSRTFEAVTSGQMTQEEVTQLHNLATQESVKVEDC